MKHNFLPPLKSWTRRAASWLALVLGTVFLASGALTLQEITFAYPKAKPLNYAHLSDGRPTPKNIEAAVASHSYLSRVGGVAFGGTAEPANGESVTAIRYNKTQRDGARLEITLNNKGKETKCIANLFDWELKPIAEFAQSDEFACFTLFGSLMDKQDEEQRLERGEKILNYHPAFENTLLGLRLMQSDVLLLYPDACDLPQDTESGRRVLGAGEKSPDLRINQAGLDAVRSHQSRLPGHPFDSYLICDYRQTVKFSASNGVLALTGNPYWYCWKNKTKDDAERRVIVDEANRRGNRAANAFSGSREAKTAQFREVWEQHVSANLLQAMPEYSTSLSDKIRSQQGINPAVYGALVKAMQYSALFRQVKKGSPQEWRKFLDAVRAIETTPTVPTPTVLILPRSR